MAPRDAGPDLSDLTGFWTAPLAERAAAFADLRARPGLPSYPEPVLPPIPPGPGFSAVTRLDDVVAASRQPEVFTSGRGATNIPDLPPEFLEFFGSMINLDDPRHARLRRIVSRGFTPRRLAALQASVDATARRIVDDIAEVGTADVVADVAARLPLRVVCDLMGVPADRHGFVLDRTTTILGAQDPEYVPEGTDVVTALLTAGWELAELVRELAAARTAAPVDDLVSALVSAEIDGERLTPDELASFFILLLVAGTETTRSAISWGVHLLSEHPDQRDAWAADVDGLAPAAVEEIVRWASPVVFMRRTLARDAELGGERLAAGAKIALFYWSANRDEAHFEDPERFDLRRDPNPHVGFGGPGPHFCLGAHLARREITAMLGELLRRLPDLRTTAPPRRLTSMFVNGITSLPCAFTPVAATR